MKQYLKARAIEAALGYTSEGAPQVAVLFTITDGPRVGEHLPWYGYFSEKAAPRTIEALRACGWAGDRLDDLTGIDANEVQLTTEEETFNGRTTEKVQWVNKAGGVALKSRMNEGQAKAFAAQMMGFVVQQKQGVAPAAGPGVAKVAPRPPARQAVAAADVSGDEIPF